MKIQFDYFFLFFSLFKGQLILSVLIKCFIFYDLEITCQIFMKQCLTRVFSIILVCYLHRVIATKKSKSCFPTCVFSTTLYRNYGYWFIHEKNSIMTHFSFSLSGICRHTKKEFSDFRYMQCSHLYLS